MSLETERRAEMNRTKVDHKAQWLKSPPSLPPPVNGQRLALVCQALLAEGGMNHIAKFKAHCLCPSFISVAGTK